MARRWVNAVGPHHPVGRSNNSDCQLQPEGRGSVMRFFESKATFAFSVILSIAIFAGQHAGAEELNILPLKISPAHTASIAQTVTNFRCHVSPVRRTRGDARPIARPYCDQPAALATAPPIAAPTDLNY